MRAYCKVRKGMGRSHFRRIINFVVVHAVKQVADVGMGGSTRTAEKKVAHNIILP